jgi:hypothetical protein
MSSEWEQFYRAAVLETDWSKIQERILVADFAIAERLQAFSLNHGGTPEENHSIRDALSALSVLRREVAERRGTSLLP